jgi:hypothetical protein
VLKIFAQKGTKKLAFIFPTMKWLEEFFISFWRCASSARYGG